MKLLKSLFIDVNIKGSLDLLKLSRKKQVVTRRVNIGVATNMKDNAVPPYEIIYYPITPPVGNNHFGAKPIVASSYRIQPNEPWNQEYWGRTEKEAIANAQSTIDSWINRSNE